MVSVEVAAWEIWNGDATSDVESMSSCSSLHRHIAGEYPKGFGMSSRILTGPVVA